MNRDKRRMICTVGLVLLLVSGMILLPSEPLRADTVMFTTGDVFIGVANGRVQWRHADGTLVQTLNTGQGGFTTGMAFDSSMNLYVTNFSAASISKFAPDGTNLGIFASGLCTPESIVFDSAGNAYVGGPGCNVKKLSSVGAALATFSTGSSDWVELASDQCTLFFNDEGSTIHRFNVCTNTLLTDFGNTGANGFAMRLLPGGDLIVAAGGSIERFNSSGAIIQTYSVAGESSWFALNLDPNGTSFWSANFDTANVYKINLATGAVEQSFNTGTGAQTVFGLAIKGEITAGGGSFDVCIQDENTGNILQINSVTGDYQFKNCDRGITKGGTGALITRGCLLKLTDVRADRRVQAYVDTCTKTATASVQVFPDGTAFTIADRNTTNNTCTCPLTPPQPIR